MGNATVVLLDERDRQDLNTALTAFATESGLSISAVAKKLGVNRTYLYSLLDANQIELSRLVKIQNLIDFRLVSDADAYLYSRSLFYSITDRDPSDDWLALCECIFLDAFYVKRFLLPAITKEIGTLSQIYSDADTLEPESVLPTFSSEVYFTSLMESYLADAINALGGEYGEIDTQFYENEEPMQLSFPVLFGSSLWMDIFELTDDLICDYYGSTEELEGADIDNYREHLEAALEDASDSEIEQLQGRLELLRVGRSHKNAQEAVMLCAKRIDSWEELISRYCLAEKRMLRRQLYFPLELKQAAEEPSLHSLPIATPTKE